MRKQPKQLFRADLLKAAKKELGREAGNLRRISRETGIAVNSIRRALAGQIVELPTLWNLAAFFGIQYRNLFNDLDSSPIEIRDPKTGDRFYLQECFPPTGTCWRIVPAGDGIHFDADGESEAIARAYKLMAERARGAKNGD